MAHTASVAMGACTAVALPQFLVATLAVDFGLSMGLRAEGLGAVIAVYFLTAALFSMPLGRLTEALGALRVMRCCCIVAAIALATIALLVDSIFGLALALVPAGIASSGVETATNQYLVRDAPKERHALAFGLKQASVPLATLLSGLAVPALALTFGWRWAFAAGAAAAAGVAMFLPRSRMTIRSYSAVRAARTDRGHGTLGPLTIVTVGSGLSVAAAGALTSFLALSVTASGRSAAFASGLVTLGGAAAVSARVLIGALVDRRGLAHYPTVVVMLGLGTLGMLLLAVASSSPSPLILVPAVALAFGAGWGWNGLLSFAIVSDHLGRPARATSITQLGNRTGGVVGPFLFGHMVSHSGYGFAWLLAALTALVGAGLITIGAILSAKLRRLHVTSNSMPSTPAPRCGGEGPENWPPSRSQGT